MILFTPSLFLDDYLKHFSLQSSNVGSALRAFLGVDAPYKLTIYLLTWLTKDLSLHLPSKIYIQTKTDNIEQGTSVKPKFAGRNGKPTMVSCSWRNVVFKAATFRPDQARWNIACAVVSFFKGTDEMLYNQHKLSKLTALNNKIAVIIPEMLRHVQSIRNELNWALAVLNSGFLAPQFSIVVLSLMCYAGCDCMSIWKKTLKFKFFYLRNDMGCFN